VRLKCTSVLTGEHDSHVMMNDDVLGNVTDSLICVIVVVVTATAAATANMVIST